MSLFQPTIIFPNLLSGDVDGTVDASDDLTITWLINGSSQMQAWSVIIRKQGAISNNYVTPNYTGTNPGPYSVEGCPTYGRDNLGDVIPFTVTIPASDITDYTNGSRYNLTLFTWWGEESDPEKSFPYNESTMVAFQTRLMPHFSTVTGYETTINSREWHFDFLKFSTVNIRYFRWQLFEDVGVDGEHVIGQTIYDTGKVYQSGDLTMDYEGFINGKNYLVQCTCCDRYGREVTSDLYPFSCVYDQVNLEFPITVSALTTGSAIHVEWEGANYMYGRPSGDYSISDDNILTLPNTSDSITWDSVGSRPFSFAMPWTVLYKGQLLKKDAILWELQTEDASKTFRLRYDMPTRHLILEQGSSIQSSTMLLDWRPDESGVADYLPVDYQATISTAFWWTSATTYRFGIRIEYYTGGLYPSESLYPGENLYPSDSTILTVEKYTDDMIGTSDAIVAIVLYGAQKCYYIQEMNSSSMTYDIYNAVIMQGNYKPIVNDGVNFNATFTNGLNAGSLYYGNSQFAGWAIYRQQAGTGITREIAELPIEAYSFNDYTARTDGTQYVYDIAPIFVADNNYTNGVAMTSGDPFGILNSNYTILETVFNTDMKCYQLLAEYHFGKNVKTGDVSNNNSPNILENFTRYPTVQLSGQNYMSGSVTSLLGTIKVDENGQVTYSDTRTMRDAIFELSTTSNTLFLKTRKGDIFEIRIANPISISVMEESPTYAQTASINWVQVDDSVDDYVLSYES